MNENVTLFDEWASSYDEAVIESDNNNTYPFAGYSKIQEMIYTTIKKRKNIRILEMGIGTGRMTFSLYKDGYDITGVDSSINMIEKAKELMPENNYIHKNFVDSLKEFRNLKFDVIIFTYSIHHISLKNQKYLLLNLSEYLNSNGEIMIGDVMTKTNKEMVALSNESNDIWDYEEFYPTFENFSIEDITNYFELDFTIVTFCSGILKLKLKD